MTDFDREETEQTQEEGRRQRQPSRLQRFFRRFLGLIVTLVVVLGLIAVALLQDSNYLDRVRRWLVYGDGGEENTYAFAADANNRYGQLGNLLVVVSQNYIQFLQDDGTAYFSQQLQLNQPALDTGGSLAVAYDIGGESLAVFSRDRCLMTLEQEEGCGIISARLNSRGYLAVVAEKNGYRGAVSVYNDQQELMFTFNASSQYLIDAAVSEDCGSVLIAALSQENGSFCTRMITYRLDQEEPEGEQVLTDHLTMDLGWLGNTYASVADDAMLFLDAQGAEAARYDYGGLYLRQYTLEGSGFAAMLLNRYQAGSIGRLVTVGEDGAELASLDITQEVLDISAAGDYLAVLMSDSLVIYNRELEEYGRLDGTGYASQVLMNSDGSALVIGGNSAFRYLP